MIASSRAVMCQPPGPASRVRIEEPRRRLTAEPWVADLVTSVSRLDVSRYVDRHLLFDLLDLVLDFVHGLVVVTVKGG